MKDNWLANIYSAFKGDTDIIISGKIELFLDNEESIWENFDKIVHMRNDLRVQKNQIATANMAVRKNTFLKIGFFAEIKSGGDYAWAKYAAEINKKIVYKENIVVLHPSRKNYQQIEKKLKRLAYGEGQLYKETNRGFLPGLFKNILRLIYLPKHIYISRNMLANVGILGVISFNFYYLCLKLKQIFAFIEGYDGDE